MSRTKTRKKSRVWTVVFFVAFAVFICSIIGLGVILYSYMHGQQVYDNISQTADATFDAAAPAEDVLATKIDWAALKAENPDTVGWIYIPNTNINYPIVQGSDDEYYLYNDFEGNEGTIAKFGCIFMEATNKPDFSDQGTFIFGHHLNDGSMFSAITDEDNFANARTIYIFTPEKNMQLRSFSLVHCEYNDPLLQTSFSSQADLTAYLQDKAARSVVSVPDVPDLSKLDKFVALSTCDNQASNGRYVLFCYTERVE